MNTKSIISILVLLSTTITTSFAQPFQPLEKTSYSDRVYRISNGANGKYIYFYTKSSYYSDETATYGVKLLEPYKGVVREQNFTAPLRNFCFTRDIAFDETTQHYFILGYCVKQDFDETDLFFLEMDTLLNVIQHRELQDTIGMHFISYFFINRKGNLLAMGAKDSTSQNSILIAEYDKQGQLLKHKVHAPQLRQRLFELNDSTYLSGKTFNRTLVLLDSDFDTIRSVEVPIFEMKGSEVRYDNFWMGAIQYNGSTPPLWQSFESVDILRFNQSLEYESIFTDTINNDHELRIHLVGRGFNYIDSNYLYYSAMASYSSVCFPDFYQECDSYIPIYSVNSNGTLNWFKLLGGDSGYYMEQILATPDLGCLLLIKKYDRKENDPFEEDMYYIKFDKDGNVEPDYFPNLSTSTTESNVPILDVLVYPNPTTDVLRYHFGSNHQNLSICLYNLSGQQVLQDAITDGQTNMEHLPSGMYVYQIYKEGELLQNGKVWKE